MVGGVRVGALKDAGFWNTDVHLRGGGSHMATQRVTRRRVRSASLPVAAS